ncbi:UDP-glucuronosyl/UDP-glucosyltransferase [Corchorus olitorius]|uniref:UDP-glucuronosyl/UDP-glucosyltransferase n=1 Tax=Corchorus olitorius TaxID=93759 RepID=A0A1R3JZU7_9ROSI|nr:UDP-glucuronosyl/UDP-glucosyltransferase [Corchorus olitorius]
MARSDIHVVMLPWSAFGHLIPFFQLSVALAKSGIKVSFISTPANIRRLPKVPSNLENLIDLVAFQLPALDEQQYSFPEGSEATVDIPSEKIQYLKIAYDLLEHPIKQFISDQRPDWILADAIPHWVVEISRDHQIPLIRFSVFSASALSFLCNPSFLTGDGQKRMRSCPETWTSPPEWYDFPSSLAYPSFLATGMHEGFYKRNASGISDAERVAKTIQGSKALAVRSCPEYEPEYFKVLEKIIGKPIIPVGLLLPEKPERRRITDKSWVEVFEWLDEQKPRSVVFVGFGSECKLSKEQVHEIANGLQLSELPFLWALRKPDWAPSDLDALPPGFSERSHGRGVVCFGWAPQLEILGHSSIGGSLFHSGWGSIIETLQFGHCLVVLPLVIDQPLNARLLVEKGLAVEIERKEDGSFSKEDVAKALRLAMVSDEGESVRVRAREAAQVFGNRDLQNSYIDNFVEYLMKNMELQSNGAINDS